MPIKTYAFGSGAVIAIADGKAPVKVGALQDIQIDLSSEVAMLYGQNQMPIATARGKTKVEGKAKTGEINLGLFNSLYDNQSALDTTGYLKLFEQEAHSVPGSSTYTVTVTHAAGFDTDCGVYYADTGEQLVPVTTGLGQGEYTVDTATGIYTFHSTDASEDLLFSYIADVNTGSKIIVENQLMGINPVFQLFLQEGFSDYDGQKIFTMKLHRCTSTKLSFPFKNTDFAISDFDFTCFQDNLGNIATIGTGT